MHYALRMVVSLACLGFSADNGRADVFSIKEVTYAEIAEFVDRVITFDEMGQPPPDALLYLEGVSFGERFRGQLVVAKQDDALVWHEVLQEKTPYSPLEAAPGPRGQNLRIAPDGHWGSLALHPLGPVAAHSLGTGTLAIRFDPPACYVAFRSGIDGMSRLGWVNNTILRGKSEGSLSILFYNEGGDLLANFMRSYNPEGPIEVGYLQSGQADAQIAGILLQNLDLGGIAIDDLRFDPECPYKLY
ncbi:MAG TPA: hypothetical protein PLM52_13555 [Tabrizicola sp.]|nr:hypothetical protein [Tabrizicola sp.]